MYHRVGGNSVSTLKTLHIRLAYDLKVHFLLYTQYPRMCVNVYGHIIQKVKPIK